MSEIPAVTKLVKALSRLPGVGRRSAERMALKIAFDRGSLVSSLVDALQEVSAKITTCSLCGTLTPRTDDPCELCLDPRREAGLLCVVEEPADIVQIEESRGYRGRYHALMGKISPMNEEGVNDIRVGALLKRVKEEPIEEVILALNSDVESDATASFLKDVLKPSGVRVSRIAFGLPAGSGIAYSDPVTLTRAIQGRRDVGTQA